MFAVDVAEADLLSARSLTTMARFLEANPQLPGASVTVFTDGGVYLQFPRGAGDLASRCEAVAFVAAQLDGEPVASCIREDGAAQFGFAVEVGSRVNPRRLTVFAPTSVMAWPAVA
jgi:hypothetical protein